METEIRDLREDIKRLMIDVAIIKSTLLNETKLTDWENVEFLADERLLAEDWLSPEDEEAWKDL
jgi:hypothetical protein